MANDTVFFQAESRVTGTKADLSDVRNNGAIPGVIYSKGNDGDAIKLNEHNFMMMLKKHSGENLMIDLEIDGTKAKHVLIKEIQHHPMTQRILHEDFHEISLDRMIRVDVHLEVEGTPVGVSEEGGTLDIQHREVEVECKASDLVEHFVVDVSELKIGDSVSAGDITLPAGFTLLTSPEISIAAVLKPRLKADEEEAEGEEGAAGAEPEVLTEKSDDEGEESSED